MTHLVAAFDKFRGTLSAAEACEAGGSATTDGGLGALEALGWIPPKVEVVVACDVRTRFVDAAAQFGPQKGARPDQVALLKARLEALVVHYRARHGIDIADLEGAGAAGGLAGGSLPWERR